MQGLVFDGALVDGPFFSFFSSGFPGRFRFLLCNIGPVFLCGVFGVRLYGFGLFGWFFGYCVKPGSLVSLVCMCFLLVAFCLPIFYFLFVFFVPVLLSLLVSGSMGLSHLVFAACFLLVIFAVVCCWAPLLLRGVYGQGDAFSI